VPIQHRVDGAAGRNLHRMRLAAQQPLADLARTPVRLLALGDQDGGFHLFRQLVGVQKGSASRYFSGCFLHPLPLYC